MDILIMTLQYMDAGSLDKLYGVGVPEPVLARIADSVGLWVYHTVSSHVIHTLSPRRW